MSVLIDLKKKLLVKISTFEINDYFKLEKLKDEFLKDCLRNKDGFEIRFKFYLDSQNILWIFILSVPFK